MLIISVRTLLAVTGGALIAGSDETIVHGLAVDSRNAIAGGLFVALPGERTDGHDFIGAAITAGARAIISARDDEQVRASVESTGRDVALVVVTDTQKAIEDLATWHRQRLTCPVIGITGSTGKTTTKDFLRAVLATRLKVVATSENRNNELGVPLTLFEADPDAEAVVAEMAMRGAGQITRLCEIARPTAGLITNVGVSHVELLGSQEAIAAAKAELARAIPPTGRVFLNGDDDWSGVLAAGLACATTRYGLSEEVDVRAEGITIGTDGAPAFSLVCEQGTAPVVLSLPGRHNVYNALAAAAVGLYLELPLSDIATGLEQATFSKWRMETFESASGITIINDAYNANPTSMRAAVAALTEMPTEGRRFAVLGDMAELGSLAELAHFEIGELVAGSGLDALVTVGERARRIADGALAAGIPPESVRPCASPAEASEVLDDLLLPGDIVLVKASRVMGLELVVEGMVEPRVQPA